ncbi:restriction endonuclease [Bradyrhizobium jicamae]|uniref:restriction endonuclease n=1 Tax=Bradyrhizobium jicamae TaxID=280332 RepID=UPI001BA599C0|nr:restriction endonuclease [Bradyrhizobium jicamae]MBR0757606.1 restriction endonuclease [Bradyrhizobium jicamae]
MVEKKGADFEARVAQLLKSSTGYKNVREQQHICGKNVDLIFEKQWTPRKYRTIAVECKDWKHGVDRQAVREIYFDYKPLFDQKEIDELWIVTPNPAAPTVQEHVDGFDGIEIFHIKELEQDIIDFSLYATHLRDRFTNDSLSKYYIPSRLENSASLLHSAILVWLASSPVKPIAIWAGYGMGKTSYASFLASQLAADFLSDAAGRIPILIPLGDFYTAPRLDGLFANILTKDNGVHGYNFNTFWNLHEAGRFVIILDGFDEMKHAMTRSEFIAISKEIRKLCLPNSRVLLLGRPDAIVSGEEHNILIKGTRTIADLEISDNMASDFDELRLDFFSEPEYREFLSKYIDCYYVEDDKREFISSRLEQVSKLKLNDLIKRPVQARMLAQILLNPKNSLESVSKYDLYEMFIEDCFTREEEKHERRKTSRSLRRRFMQDLAWWLWAVRRTRTFTVNDIPLSLANRYVAGDGDAVGQLRELLVGSIVEEKSIGSLLTEKDAGTFYFPHLSFTEFLVAEYVVERDLSADEIGLLAKSFDVEIKGFVESYKKRDGLSKLYSDLRTYSGDIPWYFIASLSESRTVQANVEFFKSQTKRDVFWSFAVEFLVLLENSPNLAFRRSAQLMRPNDPTSTAIVVQLLLKTALEKPSMRSSAMTELYGGVFRNINLDKLANTVRHPFPKFEIGGDVEDFLVFLLEATAIDHNKRAFNADLAELFRISLRAPRSIIDEQEYAPTPMSVKWDEICQLLRPTESRKVLSWLEAARDGAVFDKRESPKQRATSRPRFI